jgi:hypothetical protein
MKRTLPILALYLLASIANAGQENRGGPIAAPGPMPQPTAQVYKCDILKNGSGEPMLGSPMYAVVIQADGVYLRTTVGYDWGGPDETTQVKMRQIQGPDIQTVKAYKANDIMAIVETAAQTKVEIDSGENSAVCHAQ